MNRIFIFLFGCLFSISITAKSIDITRWQTQKGSQVLFVRANDLPMVDISIAFPAGSAFDDKHWGLAALTASLIDQGTKDLNATQIAEQFENHGAIFSSDVNKDTAQFSLRSLSYKESLRNTVSTFKTILSQTTFPLDSFNRQKEQQLTSIHYKSEKPASLASEAFYELLYPHHPYGHAILGTSKTVMQIEQDHVQTFFKTHYVAEKAVIAITGDLTLLEAQNLSNTISDALNSEGKSSVATLPVPHPSKKGLTKNITFPSNQTTIMIGQVGIDHKSPHYFPLIVGNYTLGGSGLISRLATEVREKRGLTYGVYSDFQTLLSPGPFSISLATQTKKTDEALKVTSDTLKQFLDEGPTENEVIAAQQYLIGSYPLRLSSNRSINATILNIGMYQLPNDYLDTYLDNIKKTNAAQIKSAFNETIKPNSLFTVMVGK